MLTSRPVCMDKVDDWVSGTKGDVHMEGSSTGFVLRM